MKRIQLISYMLILFTLFSCDDWLDVSPKTEVKGKEFFQKELGYKDALIGVYSLMKTGYSYGGELSNRYVDILAQYYDDLKGKSPYFMGVYQYAQSYEWKSTSEEKRLKAIWSRAYQIIANINLALEHIDNNESAFTNKAVYAVYKGEFLGLRAFLHFDMLRLFGPSPKNGLEAKSIPYVNELRSVAFPQLSIQEFVNKCIADLEKAKATMKDSDPYGPNFEKIGENVPEALQNRVFRMNYYAITALLARVHAYAGNKELALKNAAEIIGLRDNSVMMPTLFAASTSPANLSNMFFDSELLFCLKFNADRLKKEIDYYFFNEASDSHRKYTISMESTRKALLFNEQNDFRSFWVTQTSTGFTYSLNKYDSQTKMPLLKLSEMYLIAAECANNQDDQLWYLNKLRAHRGLLRLTDKNELQNEILNEYKKEFIGEGQLYYYYKRNLMTKIGSANDVTVDIDKAYSAPLPDNELEFGNYKKN